MGKKDEAAKVFFNQKDVFADAFNAILFNGKQVLDPERLTPMETGILAQQCSGRLKEYRRDVHMMMSGMDYEGTNLMLLGIEHQSSIDYAMPLRCLNYDVSTMMQEYLQIRRSNRLAKKSVDCNLKNSFCGAFHKEDRLTPVLTMVVYMGIKPWSGPRNLREIIRPCPSIFTKFLPDYKMCLLTPDSLGEEWRCWRRRFKTELGKVLYYIQMARDRENFMKFAKNDIIPMRRESLEMLSASLNRQLSIPSTEEKIPMCNALREIELECRREGRKEGRKEGKKEGIQVLSRQLVAYMRQKNASDSEIIEMLVGAFGMTAFQANKYLSANT